MPEFPINPQLNHGQTTRCPQHGSVDVNAFGACSLCAQSYDGLRLQFAEWLRTTPCSCDQCWDLAAGTLERLRQMAQVDRANQRAADAAPLSPPSQPLAPLAERVNWQLQAQKLADPERYTFPLVAEVKPDPNAPPSGKVTGPSMEEILERDRQLIEKGSKYRFPVGIQQMNAPHDFLLMCVLCGKCDKTVIMRETNKGLTYSHLPCHPGACP